MNQNLNLTSSVASKPHAHPRLPTGVLASRLKEAAGGTPVDNLSAEVILPKNPKNHPQILATKRNFKHQFSPVSNLSPARRTVNRSQSREFSPNPDVFLKILPRETFRIG